MTTAAGKRIPFVDLKAQYASIKGDIDAAIARVIENTSFILGEEVEAFEREFAAYTGFRHVVGVANGTDAIHLACKALGLKSGDHVVAPAHTFIATTEAVTQAGGSLRLADVSETTFCTTGATLERALTPTTRLVVHVPIYGNPAGMDEVTAIARQRGIPVLADCAQAHGATLHGKRMGELVDIATYSFFPGKNLGAYGDAGAVATNDAEMARTLRMWRNHGREGKFDHEFEAVNSRLDSLQAAILRAKLPHLPGWCAARRAVAASYRVALAGIPGVTLPEETPGAEHVYHLYVVRVDHRERVGKALGALGIATGVHYPAPIHRLKAYEHLGLGPGSFPAAEAVCARILSLPMYPEMTRDDVDAVARALRQVMA